MSVPVLEESRSRRMAVARQVLRRAEAVTGVRARLTGSTAATSAPLPGPAADSTPADSPVTAGDDRAVRAAEPAEASGITGAGGTTAAGVATAAGTVLPVPAALRSLFPAGGLVRGSAVQVAGSTSLLLALAAAAGQESAWCALTALPDVGWRAAAEAGLALDRVAVVPRPGPDAPAVLGALVDGFDVLVLGRCPALSERDRRSVSSRLRAREAVLLSTDPWPGAQLVLQARQGAWGGLGQGWGHLQAQELTVSALGRGAAGTGRSVEVRLGPGGVQRVAPVEKQPAALDTPLLQAV